MFLVDRVPGRELKILINQVRRRLLAQQKNIAPTAYKIPSGKIDGGEIMDRIIGFNRS